MMQCVWRWLLCTAFFLPSFGLADPVAKPTTYEFGRFTVVDHGNWLEIKGGIFTPPPELPYEPSPLLKRTVKPAKHVIFINYVKSELSYYRRGETGEYEPVVGYAVVTPAAYPDPKYPREFALRQAVVRGEVTKIIEKPEWCVLPGGQIQRDHPHLRGCYPYGHKDNPMGEYSFHIAWEASPDWDYVRLHGSRLYPDRFETADTYGCTRLIDPAIVELVDKLGPDAVAEGIEVVAHRQLSLSELAGMK